MPIVDSQWGYFPGENGIPTDLVSATIGAITSSGLTETSVNSCIFPSITFPASGTQPYYSGAYRKLASGAVNSNNTRIYNRAGALLNSLAGQPSVVSTSPLDAGTLGNAAGIGLQVRLVAQVSSLFVAQYINLNGTTQSSDVNGGVLSIDANTAWRWELSLAGSPTTCYGDVGCYVGTQLVAIIRGTLNPRRAIPGNANSMCSAEVLLAAATAKNTTIAGTNILTAPTTIGTLASAIFFGGNSIWTGSDQSIALPGDPYVASDYFGYAVQFNAIAGNIAPLGNFQVDVDILCNPAS